MTLPARHHPAISRPARRLPRFLRLAAFGLVLLLLCAFGLVLIKVFDTMRTEIAPAPSAVSLPPGSPLALEEVSFNGADGTRLAGWYLPASNAATIILLHGYGENRTSMLFRAEALAKAGYGVLLYDEYASGQSGGEQRSFGWRDAPDVGAAIRYIQAREGVKNRHIGIAGCSIGAQIAIQAAVLYPELAAIWADGPANIQAVDNAPVRNVLSGVIQVFDVLLDGMYQLRLGMWAPAPLIDQIGKLAPRPLMLVGGGQEINFFGSEAPRMAHFAAHASPNTQVWIIPEASHCDGPDKQPEEYALRLVQFFDNAFAPGR
jgi:uncharacterized protein